MRIALTTIALALAFPGHASERCTEDAMVVFDGSGSMAETGFNQLDEPRIFDARRAVERAIPPIAKTRRLGLVVYGPNGTDACNGVHLEFRPAPDAASAIIGRANTLEPAGDTALTEAVALAADVLEHRSRAGTIVLVTDGKETCGGAPCQLAAELAADSADLTIHVIGFRVRGDFFAWGQNSAAYTDAETVSRCLADRTGGLYVKAETVDELIEAFHATLGCNVLSGTPAAAIRRVTTKG